MPGKLTEENHQEMDKFLSSVFDGIKSGKINKEKFVGGMAHVIAAIDIENHSEALNWFRNGSGHFTLDNSRLGGRDKLS